MNELLVARRGFVIRIQLRGKIPKLVISQLYLHCKERREKYKRLSKIYDVYQSVEAADVSGLSVKSLNHSLTM